MATMYERYHIPLKTVAARAPRIPKFVISRTDNCVNCGRCGRACIFGVHERSTADPRKMADPVSHFCKNCFRCIAECPQGALTMSEGEEYKSIGRGVWTSLRMSTIWGEAETGKIPVFGAGYRGRFAGDGYDGMWTDMSEIVRPTRDGIHGREFISTSVDIGRMPSFLEFAPSGELTTELPPLFEIPIPMTVDLTRIDPLPDNVAEGILSASRALKTLAFVPIDRMSKWLPGGGDESVVPVVPAGAKPPSVEVPDGVRMVETVADGSWREDMEALTRAFSDKVISVRIMAKKGVEDAVLDMLDMGVAVANIEYTDEGMEFGEGGRHAMDSLRAIHSKLVSAARRDEITLIAGGGLAAAEHVPKSIICGADVVCLGKALMVAVECRNCVDCDIRSCPADIASAPPAWVADRISNLVGAWRDQMLEVLGAMGLREVRRLRGEFGRAIFFEDLERDFVSSLDGGERA
jgi:ferredoxin